MEWERAQLPRPALMAVAALAAFAAVNVGFAQLPTPPVALQVLALALVTLPLLTLAPAALAPAGRRPAPLVVGAVAAAAAAAALTLAGAGGTPATIAKLLAAACAGLALSSLLSGAAEIVVIALVVAAVDAYSVALGPTRSIVHGHHDVLGAFTLGLQPPGSAGEALLGVSDMVFFALFCAAAVRLALRRWPTWAAMTASFGLTLGLAYGFALALPALPLLSASFLLTNGDLLLRRLRRPRLSG